MHFALLAVLATAAAPDAEPPEAPASEAAPSEAVPVVLVMPFAQAGSGPAFRGVAVAEALIDEVAAGRASFYTLLQLGAVLRRRDLSIEDERVPQLAGDLTALLAATDVIAGTVKTEGDHLEIAAIRTRKGQTPKGARVEGSVAALPVLGRQLAQKLFGTASKQPPIARNAQALEAGAECAARAGAQPLGPQGRGFSLPEAQLAQLEKVCRAALALDPGLPLAKAGLSIAATVRGGPQPPAAPGRFAPLSALAAQFALRRAGKTAQARSMLEDLAAAHPGFLQVLGYLGEERLDAREDQAAVVAFDAYLAHAPGQPWAMAQKAHAMSRLGGKAESVALTREALARAPGDPEISIELASRLIDAGDDAAAEPLLRAALAATPPRPLAALRLGFLALRRKQIDEAGAFFQQAVEAARRPDEGAVRAIAHADLARVAARRGDPATTVRELDAARADGLARMPCAEPEFQALKDKPGMSKACTPPPQAATAAPQDDMSVPVDL